MTDIFATVLNFNAAADTIRCVRSLHAALPHDSIIVIDNGSLDDSVETIRSALPEIDVIEVAENRGYGSGNNIGADEAIRRGARYILLLNNDTEVIEPSFVDALRSALDEHPKAGIAGPLVLYPDSSVQPTVSDAPSFPTAIRLARASRFGPEPRIPSQQTEVEVLNGVCLLVRAQVFEATKGFDESYFLYVEEADFAVRARHLGWMSLYVPVPSIIHHHQFGDDRGSGTQVRVNFVRFCATHRGRGSAIASALLFLTGAALGDLRHARFRELPSLVRGLRDLMAGKPT
jgi:GT2 family glycosyltransferase